MEVKNSGVGSRKASRKEEKKEAMRPLENFSAAATGTTERNNSTLLNLSVCMAYAALIQPFYERCIGRSLFVTECISVYVSSGADY